MQVEYVGRAPLEGSDDNILLATLRQGEPAPAPSRLMLASARPFLPAFGGGRETAAAVPTGSAPLPPDRPFTLGESQSAPDGQGGRRCPHPHGCTSARPVRGDAPGLGPANAG